MRWWVERSGRAVVVGLMAENASPESIFLGTARSYDGRCHSNPALRPNFPPQNGKSGVISTTYEVLALVAGPGCVRARRLAHS